MENFNPLEFSNIIGWLSAILPSSILDFSASDVVYRIKIFSLFVSTLFSVGIIFVLFEVLKFRPHFVTSKNLSDEAVQVKSAKPIWENILKRIASANEADYSLAIIEADNLVDDALKKMGILGDTMMERLEALNPSEVPSLFGVIDAHRIRNNIAHTPGFKVSKDEVRALMSNYERFLTELEII